MKKNYNIGLDIGTTSVGWAVVEENTSKILKKGKKALWGVRLFDEADTAEDRRNYRNTRRRYNRRRERIKLLQEIFKNDIDITFFEKLKELKYNQEDISNKKHTFTEEEKELYNRYDTIYHLRNRLIVDDSKEDIRLVYLAIHHILKYRGNFLFQQDNFDINNLDLKEKLKNTFDTLALFTNIIDEDYVVDLNMLENALLITSKNDLKVEVQNVLSDIHKDFVSEFIKMILGNKFNVSKILQVEPEFLKEYEITTISFEDTNLDESLEKISKCVDNKIEIVEAMKDLYTTLFLNRLFKGSKNTSISAVMVEKYNKQKNDIRVLRQVCRKDKDIFDELIGNSKDADCLYVEYIKNHLSKQDFYSKVKRYLETIQKRHPNYHTSDIENILKSIDNDNFLPRITDSENGKYPYQLNKAELIKIIENQGKYYPFLLEKIDNNYKIVKILEFKIPYYVGPLTTNNTYSDFAWMKRFSEKRITPFNFDAVVDKDSSAIEFIKRMIAHCTYILSEYALPNNSLLYSKFKVLNELKQIKIECNNTTYNLKELPELQSKVYNHLFLKTEGTITDKKFKEFLHSLDECTMFGDDFTIKGYSALNKFANNMQVYIDFYGEKGFFRGTSYHDDDAETIIEWVTIFEDKDILKRKLEQEYKELDNQTINEILKKKYKGWGRLSKTLLTTKYYYDENTNTKKSIIDLMEDTKENFMEIINNDDYNFQKMIQDFNSKNSEIKKISYDLVSPLATSPATKRGIYQALKIVEEITDIMGYDPSMISIEMAREEGKKVRTLDRSKQLEEIYKKCKSEIDEYNRLIKELNQNAEKLNDMKMFLYFIQEGKCLYSMKPLDINRLNEYEIDHIIPRSLIKDNSIDNLALVTRECNQVKLDNLVLPSSYRNNNTIVFWNQLKKNGLISAKKFYNLKRKEYNDDDIKGFINRQLVETRQITKHVANILNNIYQDTKIIYLKAAYSHNYREKFELFKFRELNDYHHAHDAFLAVVLGEFKEKYMSRNINFDVVKEMYNQIKNSEFKEKLNYDFVINSLDTEIGPIIYQISKNMVNSDTGEVFDIDRFNKNIENTLYRNDIIISRKTEIRTGRFYKETIYNKEQGRIPVKKSMLVNWYGGYNNMETSSLNLVKYNNKYKLIGIPIMYKTEEEIKEFITKQINLKNNSTFKIVKNKIPFESLIIYKGQKCFIKGYSIANKNCEICNARELKVKTEIQKKYKYLLKDVNTITFDLVVKKYKEPIHKLYLTEDEFIKQGKEFIEILYKEKDNFPLFKNEITKIQNTINLNMLNNKQIANVIGELLKIYSCSSINGNLKDFGLSDRIGRLSGFNITSGTLIFQSPTGLKEVKYEFSDSSNN